MEALKFRTSFAGSIGNLLEWYDFAVFGYFAPFIGAQFFPTDDPMSALINTFGVFAAGYLARPIGGVLFGQIGDRCPAVMLDLFENRPLPNELCVSPHSLLPHSSFIKAVAS